MMPKKSDMTYWMFDKIAEQGMIVSVVDLERDENNEDS